MRKKLVYRRLIATITVKVISDLQEFAHLIDKMMRKILLASAASLVCSSAYAQDESVGANEPSGVIDFFSIWPDDSFSILAVFLAITAGAIALEKTALGKRVSGVMIVIMAAALLSNIGFLPRTAPFYGFIWNYLVPLAIALFLLKADIGSIFREGGRVLAAFIFGAAGVFAGAILGATLFVQAPDKAGYAAVLLASYTGGSLNFAAVADVIGLTDPTKLAAAATVDNVIGVFFLILLSAVASSKFFQSAFPWRSDSIFGENEPVAGVDDRQARVEDFVYSLGIAAAACAVGLWISKWLGMGSYSILFITILIVLIATLSGKPIKQIKGEEFIAFLFMYLFFGMIGVGINFSSLTGVAVMLLPLVATICVVHTVFILIGARIFKLNFAEAIIASLACIGGPPIASAIAILFGWRALVLPGVVTGVFGYVIGTFLGVGGFFLLGGVK